MFHLWYLHICKKAGHKPIILMGGGTAAIGDPSGKTDMRKNAYKRRNKQKCGSNKKTS